MPDEQGQYGESNLAHRHVLTFYDGMEVVALDSRDDGRDVRVLVF